MTETYRVKLLTLNTIFFPLLHKICYCTHMDNTLTHTLQQLGPHRWSTWIHLHMATWTAYICIHTSVYKSSQPPCIPRVLVLPPVPHRWERLLLPASPAHRTWCLSFLPTAGATRHNGRKAVDLGRLEEYLATALGYLSGKKMEGGNKRWFLRCHWNHCHISRLHFPSFLIYLGETHE